MGELETAKGRLRKKQILKLAQDACQMGKNSKQSKAFPLGS